MADKQTKEKPLEKMTAKELREVALEIDGIVGVHSMNKPELVAALKEAKGIVDDDNKNVDPAAVREAKKNLAQLKAKREEMRAAGASNNELNVMRRRLSRIKKLTRVTG